MTRIERVTIFKNSWFILSFTALMISTGCRRMTLAISSTDYSADSLVISISDETDTVSIFEEMNSSELSVPSALSSETVSEVPSKPAAQNREIKTESSAAEMKPSVGESKDLTQPSVGNEKDNSNLAFSHGSGNAIKNATAADTREVADKVVFYLNKARTEKGSGELSKLSGLTRYAEYRSGQLISNFAHDPGDWNKAAEAAGYGKYIDLSENGNTPQGYYDIGAREAIAMTGLVGNTDKVAETLAQIIIDSPRHWSYVGSDEMKYTGVGVSCNEDMWYAAIMVTNTTEYEN